MTVVLSGLEGRRDVPGASQVEGRIIQAALRCFARWGVSKTTVDDIARDAGISRATVYRTFPAGRDSILDAVVDSERRAFFQHLGAVLSEASDPEQMLRTGLSEAWKHLAGDEVLVFLVKHEPEVVLRNVAFEQLESLIAVCRELVSPYLERWLDPVQAARLAEWATRVAVSYAIAPPAWLPRPASADGIAQWADRLASALVETFFAPVLRSWLNPSSSGDPGDGGIAPAGRRIL